MKQPFRRHLTRAASILALYELDTTDHSLNLVLTAYLNMDIDEMDARVLAYLHLAATQLGLEHDEDTPPPATPFAKKEMKMFQRLVKGVDERREELDGHISRHAPDWPTEQIAVIDRNILRVAIYELMYGELPVKVAINEAVEIAKAFGSDSAPRFVNGVLGALASQVEIEDGEVPLYSDADDGESEYLG